MTIVNCVISTSKFNVMLPKVLAIFANLFHNRFLLKMKITFVIYTYLIFNTIIVLKKELGIALIILRKKADVRTINLLI